MGILTTLFTQFFITSALLAATNAPAPPPYTVKSNVVYGVAGGETLLLDIYVPTNASPKLRPGILEIHGGGWYLGSRVSGYDKIYNVALVTNGFVVFSIDYRLVKPPHDGHPAGDPWPDCFDDCQRAVRWIRANSREYHVDPNRLGATGGSAGGHLCSLLGLKETRDNSDPALAGFSSRVEAVADFFGPADLTKPFSTNNFGGISVQGMVDNLIGASNVVRQKEASPIFSIDDQTPPFLILQGEADPLVNVAQSREFAAALKHAGRDVTYLEYKGEGHGFSKLDDRNDSMAATIKFFKRTLAAP